MTDSERTIRYQKMQNEWPWDHEFMHIINPHEATKISGIDLSYSALFLPKSGTVSPKLLTHYFCSFADTRISLNFADLSDLEHFDAVILATGYRSKNFPAAAFLPLRPVRGQVTYAACSSASLRQKTAICYGGYAAPVSNSCDDMVIGATFNRGNDTANIQPQDDVQNLQKLQSFIPQYNDSLRIVKNWAGVRTTSPDHMPIIGMIEPAVETNTPLFISTAHGSHGILSSLLGAKILCSMITNTVQHKICTDLPVMQCISPKRFSHAC
jgi:tRNA 5-methylaminomethyl-2-thiouridine biosynthesis bifunctional protein